MAKRTAACDRHFPNELRKIVPDDTRLNLRVENVATPDEHYTCPCGVPAHWFVMTLEEGT